MQTNHDSTDAFRRRRRHITSAVAVVVEHHASVGVDDGLDVHEQPKHFADGVQVGINHKPWKRQLVLLADDGRMLLRVLTGAEITERIPERGRNPSSELFRQLGNCPDHRLLQLEIGVIVPEGEVIRVKGVCEPQSDIVEHHFGDFVHVHGFALNGDPDAFGREHEAASTQKQIGVNGFLKTRPWFGKPNGLTQVNGT